MNIKITEEELFDLLDVLSIRMQFDEELIPLYEKLAKYQKPIDHSKQNFDYEIPEFNPKVIEEEA